MIFFPTYQLGKHTPESCINLLSYFSDLTSTVCTSACHN